MSAIGLVLLALICLLVVLPAVLGARSAGEGDRQLAKLGKLAVAEILTVERTEDVVVRFEFLLPDGRSVQRGTDFLPITFRTVQVGEKMVVRFNPRMPAICRLVPDADVNELVRQVTNASEPARTET
jgi:hypothetical protein